MKSALEELFGSRIQLGIVDKSAEKRSLSGNELQILCARKLSLDEMRYSVWMDECILLIRSQLISSPYPHYRMGGIQALVSLMAGCTEKYFFASSSGSMGVVLTLVNDDDSRVRLFACDALVSMAKILQRRTLECFSILFESVCKMSADNELDIRQAASGLDRLLKELVVDHYRNPENAEYRIPEVVHEHFSFPSIFAKQVCLGWILLLESIPGSNFFYHLADFLPPLLSMMSLESVVKRDVSVQAEKLLSNLLNRVERKNLVAEVIDKVLDTLVKHIECTSSGSTQMLFRWLEAVGLKCSNSDLCADLILGLLGGLDACTSSPDTVELIKGVHLTLFSSDSFKRNLIDSDSRLLQGLRIFLPSLRNKPICTQHVLEWLSIVPTTNSESSSREDHIDLFFELDVCEDVVKFVLARFSIQSVAIKLLRHSESNKRIAKVLAESVPPHQQTELMFQLIENSNPSHQSFLFAMICASLKDDRFSEFRYSISSKKNNHDVDSLVKRTCTVTRIGAISLALFAGKFFDASLISSQEVVPEDEPEIIEFSNLFETRSFVHVRKTLLTPEGKPIGKCLLNLCAVIGQESRAFGPLFNRLQLVTVFVNSL